MTRLQREMQRMADDNNRIEALESEVLLLKQSVAVQKNALAEKDAEIARLGREVEHRLDEMNLQARWTKEAQDEIARLRAVLDAKEREFLNAESERATLREAVNTYQPQILAMRAALKPFAEFAKAFDAQPLRGIADEFYGIHFGTKYEANLKISDCHAALKALGEEA